MSGNDLRVLLLETSNLSYSLGGEWNFCFILMTIWQLFLSSAVSRRVAIMLPL